MVEDPIPNDIRHFILANIDSIGQLEALLLLRAAPAQSWSIGDVAKRLYVTEQETAPLLAGLCERGLIVVRSDEPIQYAYQQKSADLARMVDRLAEVYSKHLVPVTNLIHSKPRTRIQEFADAFKLRKEE